MEQPRRPSLGRYQDVPSGPTWATPLLGIDDVCMDIWFSGLEPFGLGGCHGVTGVCVSVCVCERVCASLPALLPDEPIDYRWVIRQRWGKGAGSHSSFAAAAAEQTEAGRKTS